jgi:hypothetical protein
MSQRNLDVSFKNAARQQHRVPSVLTSKNIRRC